MHISKVTAEDFKRFTKLEILALPPTAKLVILAGANGNGKSSLFDVFVKYFDRHSGLGGGWEPAYHAKITDSKIIPAPDHLDVDFHEQQRAHPPKRFYFRTAYRNQPEFSSGQIGRPTPALSERRINRFIDNDVAVGPNYHRLYALGLESAFEDDETMQLKEWKQKLLGDVQDALKAVMPELVLENLGNPFNVQTFRFSKGASKHYNYMNLSGGEKAAFDLLLDFVVKKREFDDTVFCIDEPEAHLNPKVHGKMLDALLGLVEPKCQLWIATHAVGMMRRARDLYYERPGEIVFLDFDQDFDKPQVLRPLVPDRAFWERSLAVALDDMAALVAPKTIVACESGSKDGKPGEGYDAAIYNEIFGDEFPEVRFISIGAATQMEGDRFLVLQAVGNLIKGTTVMRLIDRDGMTDKEKAEQEAKGYRVLGRRHIESYLYDKEVLVRLCAKIGKSGPDRCRCGRKE
jgi:predicted ATPase